MWGGRMSHLGAVATAAAHEHGGGRFPAEDEPAVGGLERIEPALRL